MSLYLEQLVQRFDKTLALKEINLEIREGEFLAILGPSGCGKTTLLRSIGGFIQPSEGVIRKDDEIYSGKGRMVPVEAVSYTHLVGYGGKCEYTGERQEFGYSCAYVLNLQQEKID